jgi:hypothetical protein
MAWQWVNGVPSACVITRVKNVGNGGVGRSIMPRGKHNIDTPLASSGYSFLSSTGYRLINRGSNAPVPSRNDGAIHNKYNYNTWSTERV